MSHNGHCRALPRGLSHNKLLTYLSDTTPLSLATTTVTTITTTLRSLCVFIMHLVGHGLPRLRLLTQRSPQYHQWVRLLIRIAL